MLQDCKVFACGTQSPNQMQLIDLGVSQAYPEGLITQLSTMLLRAYTAKSQPPLWLLALQPSCGVRICSHL